MKETKIEKIMDKVLKRAVRYQVSGIRSSGGMSLGIGQNGEKTRGKGEMEKEKKTEG